MTKKEFMKLEKKHGLDYAVDCLENELSNKGKYLIYAKWYIVNEIYRQFLNGAELAEGVEKLNFLVQNDTSCYVFKNWDDIKPIKSIDDIEEFLEED